MKTITDRLADECIENYLERLHIDKFSKEEKQLERIVELQNQIMSALPKEMNKTFFELEEVMNELNTLRGEVMAIYSYKKGLSDGLMLMTGAVEMRKEQSA